MGNGGYLFPYADIKCIRLLAEMGFSVSRRGINLKVKGVKGGKFKR